MSLPNWPDELVQLTVQHLESESDINCFARTNRRFYSLLNDYLYRYHIQRSESSALLWAAYHGVEGTARILLREGANVNVEASRSSRFPGQTPLAMAVQNRDEDMVRLFVDSKADPNIKDGRYMMSPLAWAAAKGHLGIFKLLFAMDGVDPDPQSAVCRTPLSHAVEIGDLDIAKLLLEKNADPNSKDNVLGRTPLLWATTPKPIEDESEPTAPLPWASREESMRERRLQLGVNAIWYNWQEVPAISLDEYLKSADYEGGTLHPWAAGDAYKEILDLLLVNGADIDLGDRQNRTPVLWAAKYGSVATLAQLLEKGARPDLSDNESRTPLSWAAQRGSEARVVLLLAKGVDVNLADSKGRTPLSWAAGGGHREIVELLLNEGADPAPSDSNGQTALSWAAGGGYIAIVRLLHEKGAVLNPEAKSPGRIPLAWAAENGHDEVVQFLLHNGVCPESGDGMEMQLPLYGAAKNGHLGVVKQLLEKSVGNGYRNKPGSKNFNERTALSVAARNGHEAVLKYLLEQFSRSVTERRLNLLLDAARNGHTAVVKLILSLSHTDLNSLDYQGMTPLSVSVLNQHRDVAKLLLSVNGIDVNHPDKYGWTALSWAAMNQDTAMMKLLLDNGAEQYPYQIQCLEGDPRPSYSWNDGCCFPSCHRTKLSHS